MTTKKKEDQPAANFRLTSDDVEILRFIHDHRFLRREQICALTGRHPQPVHRRLKQLEAARYLSPFRLPQQKYIYRLKQPAITALVARGLADEERANRRIREHELKPLFLDHEMMIVSLHVVLNLASKEGPTRLVDWQEGREIYDVVTVADQFGSDTLPIRPDAFFKLEDTRWPADKRRTSFVAEADRSTMTQTRFRDKLRGYWHYINQGRPEKKFGVKKFRVLTVTLTPERAQNLRALAIEVLPPVALRYFLFCSIESFSLESPAGIFGSVYLSPRDDLRHPLIPAPPPLAEGQGNA